MGRQLTGALEMALGGLDPTLVAQPPGEHELGAGLLVRL